MKAHAQIDPVVPVALGSTLGQDRDHQHLKIILDVLAQDLQDPQALERQVLIQKLAMNQFKNVKVRRITYIRDHVARYDYIPIIDFLLLNTFMLY